MAIRSTNLAPGDVPADIRRGLVNSLFADSLSMTTGCLSSSAFGAVVAWHMHSVIAYLLVAATLAATAVRLYLALAHMRRVKEQSEWDVRLTERVYVVGVCVYLFCLGMLGFVALVAGDAFSLSVTIFIAITNMTGIAIRNFAIRYGVGLQIAAIGVPLALGIALRGGVFWLLMPMNLLLCYFIYSSAIRLRDTLLSEMSYRRRSDIIAQRFNFAIDNMSHGMCMIDRDMRIVVSNAEMSECFGLPITRSLQGTRFAALMRLARRRGTLSGEDVERFMASFDATLAPDSLAQIESPGAWGRTYELTLKRHDEGGWVLVSQDVTDARRARAALDAAARFDPMTGLPNRRSFEEKLTEALAAGAEHGARTEVLFLDIDGFKQINDTLGHKFGDRVLAESARRLREAAGDAYVSRWGGDEFIVLRSGTDDAATVAFAERMIGELAQPMWIEGAQVATCASVGAAVCVGAKDCMDALLQQADMALYAAKRDDRGGCRLYEPSMSERAHQRRLLELDLQAALAARTFELHYQPIVDIETGELVSFEALARWRHPTRGAVSPALFVPVLEDLNLTSAFGAWALQRACEDAMAWPQPLRVGVNVSSRQMDTLVDSVSRALSLSGLPAERLELEITETAALAAGEKVIHTLEAVRALGVRIALDDFGTGYSSLSHLLQLPLDKVKIDKSFTQELGKSRRADVLVASIARISSQLGMRVTFEGIETVEQLDRARALGVRAEGQGWLFGRPAPARELGALFALEKAQAVA